MQGCNGTEDGPSGCGRLVIVLSRDLGWGFLKAVHAGSGTEWSIRARASVRKTLIGFSVDKVTMVFGWKTLILIRCGSYIAQRCRGLAMVNCKRVNLKGSKGR